MFHIAHHGSIYTSSVVISKVLVWSTPCMLLNSDNCGWNNVLSPLRRRRACTDPDKITIFGQGTKNYHTTYCCSATYRPLLLPFPSLGEFFSLIATAGSWWSCSTTITSSVCLLFAYRFNLQCTYFIFIDRFWMVCLRLG